MINSLCKKQGSFIMQNNKKKNWVSYLKGFAIGYFITDFIFSLFIPKKNNKRRRK